MILIFCKISNLDVFLFQYIKQIMEMNDFYKYDLIAQHWTPQAPVVEVQLV